MTKRFLLGLTILTLALLIPITVSCLTQGKLRNLEYVSGVVVPEACSSKKLNPIAKSLSYCYTHTRIVSMEGFVWRVGSHVMLLRTDDKAYILVVAGMWHVTKAGRIVGVAAGRQISKMLNGHLVHVHALLIKRALGVNALEYWSKRIEFTSRHMLRYEIVGVLLPFKLQYNDVTLIHTRLGRLYLKTEPHNIK